MVCVCLSNGPMWELKLDFNSWKKVLGLGDETLIDRPGVMNSVSVCVNIGVFV